MVAERKNKKIHQSGDKSSSPRFYNSTIYTIDIWDLEGSTGPIAEEGKWNRYLWFNDFTHNYFNYFNYKLLKNQSMEIIRLNFTKSTSKTCPKIE